MSNHGSVLLSAWRKRSGRSQWDIARAIGVRQATLSDWERGSKHPHIDNALRIEEISNGEVPVRSWRTVAPTAPVEALEAIEPATAAVA
jgi:DNA-binding XRE family transcriptional regulator